MAVMRHKEAIHSGHFMVSNFEAEAQDDEEDIAVPVPEEAETAVTVPDVAVQERAKDRFDSLVTLLNSSDSGPNSQIDCSFTKLFQCMSIAYRQKLTSPKWNRFLGMKLRWKDKIRLNNVIWRCWHMQFIKGHRKLVCAFANPLDIDNHSKTEAGAIMEGKYWKRRLGTVLAEYKKWRVHTKKQMETMSKQTISYRVQNLPRLPPHDVADLGYCTTSNFQVDAKGNDDIGLESMINDANFFVDAFLNSADLMPNGFLELPAELMDLGENAPMEPVLDWLYNKLPDSTPNQLQKGARSRAELEDQHNFFPVLDIKDVQESSSHSFSSSGHQSSYRPAGKGAPALIQRPARGRAGGSGDWASGSRTRSAGKQWPNKEHKEWDRQEQQQGTVHGTVQGSVQGPAQGPAHGTVQGPAHGTTQGTGQGTVQRVAVRGSVIQGYGGELEARTSVITSSQARPSHLVSGVGQPRSLEDRVLVAGRTLEDTTLLQHRVVEDRLMGQPRVLEDRLLGQPRVLEDRTQLAGRTLEDSRTLVALLQPGGRTRLGQRPMKNVNLPHKVVGPPVYMKQEGKPEDLSLTRSLPLVPPLPPGSLPQPAFTLGAAPAIEPEDLRQSSAEQKRRGTIKNGFEFLRVLVPSLSQTPNVKVSKAALLTKGSEYVMQLKEEKAALNKEVMALRTSVEQLNQEILGFQAQLPTAGSAKGSLVAGPSRLPQLFDRHIAACTLHNWKYWVFSRIMQPLLVSYDRTVSSSSPEDLARTAGSWLDQHASLVQLRPLVLNSLKELSVTTDVLSSPHQMPQEALNAVSNRPAVQLKEDLEDERDMY